MVQGGGKLTERHKQYLLKWVQNGDIKRQEMLIIDKRI